MTLKKQLAICRTDANSEHDDLFNKNSPLNRDDCLSKFRVLRDEFSKHDWECHTPDFYRNNAIAPDAILFNDIPKQPLEKVTKALFNNVNDIKSYAVLNECEIILPHNWEPEAQQQFTSIFSWKKSQSDGKQHHLLNIANDIHCDSNVNPPNMRKLCTLIAANHQNSNPKELYSERVKFIRWFEKNHPSDFDFYGRNWDRKIFYKPRALRLLNRFPALSKFLASHYPCYRGPITSKQTTLQQYKFSICFENARGIDNYITEKIFDCFKAGCIPIYWGAANITQLIPHNCFVNFTDFKDYDDVYNYINKLSDDDVQAYQENIRSFMKSDKAYLFSNEHYAKTITNTIIEMDEAK